MKLKQQLIQYPSTFIFLCIFFIACNNKTNKIETDSILSKIEVDSVPIQSKKRPIILNPIFDTLNPEKVTEPITIDTSKKYIYLTFDDGPQHGTVACFDLCKELNVKATFFMVGFHASSVSLRNIVREIDNNYPQTLLANHSFSHARNKYHYFYNHDSLATADLIYAQELLKVPFKIIRLPGSNSWVLKDKFKAEPLAKKVCKKLDSLSYNVIGWDLEWNFNGSSNPVQSANEMIERVYSKFQKNQLMYSNHLMILTHDRMFRNANYTDSLRKFISTLQKDSSFIFETSDHYPGLKPLH